MQRPIIAVNMTLEAPEGAPSRLSVHQAYFDAVLEAGGLPLAVPPRPELAADYLAKADGVLFTGGLDYPPALYGEKPHPKVEEQTPERTAADLKLMTLARKSQKPALGICAGLQLLNIQAGGGLVQHLPTADDHTRSKGKDSTHTVEVVPGTALAGLFGPGRLRVNSSHHQAANPSRLGKGLRATAFAQDGTIEGLEPVKLPKHFFVFVQWHPERIDDPAHRRRIFSAFVEACK